MRLVAWCAAIACAVGACSHSDGPLVPQRPPSDTSIPGATDARARAAAWLTSVAVPLATVEAGEDLSDLEPLRGMIGTARIVGMGEGTHGTSEFFKLKHRVFEYLVREMGFTHFAIEATWPEANDVNTYVLTGQGNHVQLLSDLYFWTWNTQEVLDLIRWMREWNSTAPASRRVQFLGFDMQFPGVAMDTVASFIGRVDPATAAFVSDKFACIAPYTYAGGNRFKRPSSEYAALSEAERQACRQALLEVFSLMSSRADAYRGASSEAAYQNALHSARLVQQFEEMASQASQIDGSRVRDRSMAENVGWLMQQAGPTARMMLWAHNGHVANVAGYMGAALRSAYGDDYVNLGFLFGTGSFNAVEMSGSRHMSLRALSANVVPDGSLESLFFGMDQPLLLFDARRIPEAGSAAGILAGPLPMRSIGAAFDPAQEADYFGPTMLPDEYQLLIFVRTSSPSTLLP